MGTRFYRSGNLSFAQQNLAIQSYFPNFRVIWKRKEIAWIGLLVPSGLSTAYEIKVIYTIRKPPKVWVLDPPLVRRSEDEAIPHLYPDGSLCLYLPGSGEWNRNKLIVNTVIPWTSLYLFYYEAWLITGEWIGGGQHPPAEESESEPVLEEPWK